MESISSDEKTCVDCKTSKTPLWRSGPAGPKSLCNACGIRFRKKTPVIGTEKRSPSPASSASSVTASNGNDEMKNKKGEMIRKKLVALGKEVVLLQRQRSPMKKVKRKIMMFKNEEMKFGEVEQAAVLLMSLSSCGPVFG
ncbi:GATA transcription factor 15-like [Rutidosis leptorrhynchoides]|uniref:GATA transcription factor 15-like n=1 Tax=Rutidosis leptorrhynchoides TaxID=125765 RepID=UPI003A994ADB